MSARVYIKICDSGWIIEKMARQLAERIPGVEYGLVDRFDVPLNYYMPYLTYATPGHRRAMGYFTHQEADEQRHQLFERSATLFELCVSHSVRYAEVLKRLGATRVSVISPGVDLGTFTPEIRIGIVGRTYDSGRKGEHLLAQMLDIPHIRWTCTGTGWPIESTRLSDAEMPAFYRSMDYILVTSLIEGGPMCVAEALACGTEVIAPDVGWVPEFPHIPYETGNAESLRNVLLSVVQRRLDLRASVLSRTWDHWVTAHAELFDRLLSHPE